MGVGVGVGWVSSGELVQVGTGVGCDFGGELVQVGGGASHAGGEASHAGGEASHVGGEACHVGLGVGSDAGGEASNAGGDVATQVSGRMVGMVAPWYEAGWGAWRCGEEGDTACAAKILRSKILECVTCMD